MDDDEMIANDAITVAQVLVDVVYGATGVLAHKYPCKKCRAVLVALATDMAADLCEQIMEENVDREHYELYEMIIENMVVSATKKKGRTIQ